MPCLFPISGWRSRERHPVTKRRNIVYSFRKGLQDQKITVPCGRCISCRLEKSRQWALRCSKEASLYEQNCVVTLTYANEHLPPGGSIQMEDVQKWMKRLREHYGGKKIRSYGCAEYGEKYGRPHYHVILFNHDFSDKKIDLGMQGLKPEHKYFTSETLDELWGMGKTQIMDCNFETAAYVARYVTKKISGPAAENHYGGKMPERSVCVSRRPGIGNEWYKLNKQHIYNQDTVYERGVPMRPPKSFDRQFEIENPDDYKKIKQKRKRAQKILNDKLRKAIRNGDYTNAFNQGFGGRDSANAICTDAKLKLLKRGIE